MCEPLLKQFHSAKWMTVGDGRFGSDAHFFLSQGIDVLATSLTDQSLIRAHEKGYIDRFASINAEQIDLNDDAFDFVYCKEAYHHFPRPPVAFYEMLRVASKGVILVEPHEERPRPLGWIKAIAKRLLWNQPIHFERGGNFIYRIDPRAIEKLMCAIGNEGAIAFKLFNDFYHPSLAKQKASPPSVGFTLLRGAIITHNILCKIGLMDYALICLIALKNRPSKTLAKELKKSGFRIIELPINPYRN